ncbi:MAG: enoyl-CoA hydratase/isomerase family protein [Acidobacteria bacterium]|nr:enoyl-CoA hydratase/isomerase family protein [Acidobacteriota bacterium]MBI3280905.1 enoyl-CoA hydratase/isomerase family protein [Acidobacteriota bacterium]
MSESLLVSQQGRVRRLNLNRPEKRNALSADLCRRIVEACEEAGADSAVGSILLQAGGPVFCAGMDLDEVLAPEAASLNPLHERLFTLGARLSKPMVCAVQGPALGGGVGLLANAHVVVAAQGATFGLTEIRIAMWPFVIFRAVAAAIGERRTVELSLTGRVFAASDALQWGLIHEIAPPFEYDDRAFAIAAHLADSSADAIRSGLRFVRETRGLDSQATAEIAARFRRAIFASADFREGVEAFRAKRKPRWPSVHGPS